jgi:hypothetical protein
MCRAKCRVYSFSFASRIVDQDGPPARQLQHQREIQVGLIERRILADEDRLGVREANLLAFTIGEVRRGIRYSHPANGRPHVAVFHIYVVRLAVQRRVTVCLRRTLEREGRILVRQYALHRIHHVDETHANLEPLLNCGVSLWALSCGTP